MVIRVPKWVLGIAGAVALLAIGVLVGLLLSGSGSSDASKETDASLPCTEATGRDAIADSPLADELSGPGTNLPNLFEFFQAEVVACKDLTDDGQPEMIVQLLGQTGAAPRPWAIFEPTSRGWSMALSRRYLQADLTMTEEGVTETIPAYATGDPTCCPSARRSGALTWDGRKFSYRPATGSRERRVAVAGPEGAKTIAGLDPRTATEPDSVQIFGIPSSVSSLDSSCRARWTDIGLEIIFADLGGGDPCSAEGSFVAAIFSGTEAEQAGWEIGGLKVGSPVERMFSLYPEASVGDRRYYEAINTGLRGTPFVLAAKKSPIGYSGRLPTFAALASDGRIVALDLHSGAAGD